MRISKLAVAWIALLLCTGSLAVAAGDVPLVDAVRSGNVAQVRALLQQRIDVNAAEPDGTTALHWAARGGEVETARLLVAAGAKVNATNRYGVTPLSLASVSGSGPLIELLLNAGADPNTSRAGGETALMTAARTGSVPAVQALLARGADVRAKDPVHGQTALMWAVAENNASVVEVLLGAGADVHARSAHGFTPLLFAARAGHIDTARVLLAAGADVNATLPNGMAALLLAVINARYELAALLLDNGADARADAVGWTALHHVAWTRRPNTGFNHPEPVHADNLDSLELVRRLIAHGADPNARIRKDLRDEPRTGLNALNRTGSTPFLLAAKSADVALMRVLAGNGADPLLANADNTSPLMVAAGVSIFAPGEDPGTNEEALEAVKLALELGGDVNAVDGKGDTALHGAATRGANALVRFLVEKGARLDAKNKRGWIPLTIAEGVMIGGTVKRQPETAALLRQLMKEKGLPLSTQPQ
jgi:ankyrin repeat protein